MPNQPKIHVCQRTAEQMGAAGYAVFDDLEEGRLGSYVFENQFNNWKASFRSEDATLAK